MRLPAEQEQNVVKCRQCPKFFLSAEYLRKHYSKNHPGVDFYKDHPSEDAKDGSGSQVEEIKGKQEEL